MKTGWRTDCGVKRACNEDTVIVLPERGLFVVADGMGGHEAGEIASAVAAREVATAIRHGLVQNVDGESLIRDSILEAHRLVLALAERNPQWEEMGTTVLIALWVESYFLLGHVGDSRAYVIGEGSIHPLTTDHTFVAEWLAQGTITKEQARNHQARHGLTMAVGVDDELDPVLTCVPWTTGRILLLCSDGLTEMLDDEEILSIVVSARNLQEACDRLVAAANNRGGTDNITVVLVSP